MVTCTDDKELVQFLNNIKLKELSETLAKVLDEPIKEWEIHQVISHCTAAHGMNFPHGDK